MKTKKPKKTEKVCIMTRIDPWVNDRLEELADDDHRSKNNMLEMLIRAEAVRRGFHG